MRLDLHGLTIQQAHATFIETMAVAVACDVVSLEVITGQGRNAAGRIRHEFPIWAEINPLRMHIVSVTQENKRNPGAFLVRLRKQHHVS